MSNCSKFSELISAYADGEVTNEEKTLVESHINTCESCKQKLDFILKSKEALKATPIMPVPDTLLKDFAEYRNKHEKQEKKVVPFYKNYRMFAGIAAVFVFAFVLKSNLWQDKEKYLSQPVSNDTYQGQTLTASGNQNPSVEEVTDLNEKAETQPKNVPVEQSKMHNEAEVSKPEAAVAVADIQASGNDLNEQIPAAYNGEDSSDNSSSGGGGGASPYARIIEPITEDGAEDEVNPLTMAEIYVEQTYFEKATELFSEDAIFLHQAEQKLSENGIPFESNFLLLDESMPYQVKVLLKEETKADF